MAKSDQDRSFQDKDASHGKDTPPYANKPGQEMMGDGTEEQNLDQQDQGSKITKDEVEEAYRDQGRQNQQPR
ncbi:MAG: hypothetical protein JWQ97_3318 [Phenylobacterium sp.]|nr:hypothetical protein [Phenylobacterium sp.]